jgi:hypothetical protein
MVSKQANCTVHGLRLVLGKGRKAKNARLYIFIGLACVQPLLSELEPADGPLCPPQSQTDKTCRCAEPPVDLPSVLTLEASKVLSCYTLSSALWLVGPIALTCVQPSWRRWPPQPAVRRRACTDSAVPSDRRAALCAVYCRAALRLRFYDAASVRTAYVATVAFSHILFLQFSP